MRLILIIAILIPIYSFACALVFNRSDPEHRNNFIQMELKRYKRRPHDHSLDRFTRGLEPSEIMDNFSLLFPAMAEFFTAKQLKPQYSKLRKKRSTRLLWGQDAYLSLEGVKKLKVGSVFYRDYGPLPHLPVEFVPHLKPKAIQNLRGSIRYLSDKVEYMTKEQIQALYLYQIDILAESLKDAGQSSEFSERQITNLLKFDLELFRSLRHIDQNSILVNIILKQVNNRLFPFSYIPIDVVNIIPTNKFSLEFLQALKNRSYIYFNNISLQKIYDMDFDLQKYIVTERWNVFLNNVQPELEFRNLSVEKFKQLSAADKQTVLDRVNISEELFLNVLAKS